jgi:hypothetical protein
VLLTRLRSHNRNSRITLWDQLQELLFHKLKLKEQFSTSQFNQTRFNHNMFKLLHKFQLLPEILPELTRCDQDVSEENLIS